MQKNTKLQNATQRKKFFYITSHSFFLEKSYKGELEQEIHVKNWRATPNEKFGCAVEKLDFPCMA